MPASTRIVSVLCAAVLTLGAGSCSSPDDTGGRPSQEDAQESRSPLDQACDGFFNGSPSVAEEYANVVADIIVAFVEEFDGSNVVEPDLLAERAEVNRVVGLMRPFDLEDDRDNPVPAPVAQKVRELEAILDTLLESTDVSEVSDSGGAYTQLNQLRRICGIELDASDS